jgi:hypothetical protein
MDNLDGFEPVSFDTSFQNLSVVDDALPQPQFYTGYGNVTIDNKNLDDFVIIGE